MPEWKQEIAKRLAGANLRAEREAEIIEELSNHLQDRCDQLLSGGTAHEEARRQVLVELDATDLQAEVRDTESTVNQDPLPAGAAPTGQWFSDLLQDLRY